MNRIRHIALALTILAATVTLPGCLGYSGKNIYRKGIKTIAVPIWKRGENVFRRDHEMTLTESLIKQVELTPYAVTTRDRADTVIEGTITNITQSYMSTNPDTGEPRERQLTFFLTFRWTDLRTGKVILEKQNFPVTTTYRSGEPLNQDFTQAMQLLCDKAALRIVELMENDWTVAE